MSSFLQRCVVGESVNLIQMLKHNRKLYYHDGEQLGFYKKCISKPEQKEGCSCNLYITRNEEFLFISQNCTEENVKCHIQHEEN